MEFLPERDKAYIPEGKVKDYLLSESHVVGKTKAKFFRSLGYTDKNMHLLEEHLLSIAQKEPVKEQKATRFGTKYIVDGNIVSPTNITSPVRTVWIIERGDDRPRLITAYPMGISHSKGATS